MTRDGAVAENLTTGETSSISERPQEEDVYKRQDLLTAGVLSNLRQVTEYAARHESRFVKLLIQQNEIGGKRKTAAATKQLEQAQERISEVSRIIKRLYEDNVNGLSLIHICNRCYGTELGHALQAV